MINILLADKFESQHLDSFKNGLGQGFEVAVYTGEGDCLVEMAKKADIIVAYSKDTTAEIIDAAKNLKLVVKLGTAKGNIDMDTLAARNIPMVITDSPALISVAEHAFMFMLALSKEVVYSNFGVRASLNPLNMKTVESSQLEMAYNWLDLKKFDSMYGKTLGIIGLGTVGKRLTKMAHGFDMEVMYYSIPRLSSEEENRLNVRYGCFEEVLSSSDFISTHLNLNDSTRAIFNAAAFRKMKKTAYFINTSRGPVVCEKDLCKALEEGVIAGAGIDVYEVEPLPENSPLKKLDNVILTAHSAGIQLHKSLFTEFKQCAQVIKTINRLERLYADIIKMRYCN